MITGGSSDPHVMRLMPPLVTPLEAVDEFADHLREALDEPIRA